MNGQPATVEARDPALDARCATSTASAAVRAQRRDADRDQPQPRTGTGSRWTCRSRRTRTSSARSTWPRGVADGAERSDPDWQPRCSSPHRSAGASSGSAPDGAIAALVRALAAGRRRLRSSPASCAGRIAARRRLREAGIRVVATTTCSLRRGPPATAGPSPALNHPQGERRAASHLRHADPREARVRPGHSRPACGMYVCGMTVQNKPHVGPHPRLARRAT